MRKFSWRGYLLILFIPLAVLITSLFLRAASGPFWQFADPSYNYLFNAIQIVKYHTPTDFCHPGTPLQGLIALTILVFNLGRSNFDAVNRVLVNPEFYLNALYVVLVLGSFITLAILSVYIYRKTKDMLAVLLAQLPLLSFLIMPSFDNGSFPVVPVVANVSAEPLFIIIMNLFNLSILALYFSKKSSRETLIVLFLAFVCGLGMGTKIDFIFILLSAFIIVPLRKKALFTAALVVFFIICTLPIVGKYLQLFSWIGMILGHSSLYGGGSKEFFDGKYFMAHLGIMIEFYWFFIFPALGLFIWSLVRMIKNWQDRNAFFIGTLSICCLLHFAVVANHFSAHYLLPCFALFAPMLVVFYLDQAANYRIVKPLTMVLILIFMGGHAVYTMAYYKKLQAFTHEIRQFGDKISVTYPQCTIIPSTSEDSLFFINEQEALHRGNAFTYRLESEDLYRLYPKSYYFFAEEVTSSEANESYGIWNFKERVYADDILAASPCAIFVKYTTDFSLFPFQVRLLEKSKYLNALLVTGSTEKQAEYMFYLAIDSLKKKNYQQAMAWALKSRELNYKPRGQLEYLIKIIYNVLMKSQPSV